MALDEAQSVLICDYSQLLPPNVYSAGPSLLLNPESTELPYLVLSI